MANKIHSLTWITNGFLLSTRRLRKGVRNAKMNKIQAWNTLSNTHSYKRHTHTRIVCAWHTPKFSRWNWMRQENISYSGFWIITSQSDWNSDVHYRGHFNIVPWLSFCSVHHLKLDWGKQFFFVSARVYCMLYPPTKKPTTMVIAWFYWYGIKSPFPNANHMNAHVRISCISSAI